MSPKGLVKTQVLGAPSVSKARAGPEKLHFEQVFSDAKLQSHKQDLFSDVAVAFTHLLLFEL